ncbi:Bug family tripartite tricarboxylate transporter substrate binding protein [Variovorax sp. HJSM1_2]|uniref:Bug family tripartite tricarboxylate transporter substrate binding protein n=1 Tax=Variovorax sp. HJSM1_2 TaxID=3366263 RepID=UPI003BECC274
MNLSKRSLLLSLSMAAVLPTAAWSQAFPNKPVKIILPFPAGTGPDGVMRLVGEKLGKLWNTSVIIDNRPGGNGWIAVEAAKRSAPDGYTFLQVDASYMTIQPHLYKKMPFDPFHDFEPVGPMYRTNYFIVVAADSKWKSVADLAAAAKEAKGQLTYGSSGVGSQLHVNAAILETALGLPMNHIPIKDTPQIYVSIARGDIAWAFGTAATVGPLAKSGKVRMLAIAAPQRHPSYPDIPTVRESGGPANVEARTWVALFAPTGVPKPIVDKVNADLVRVMSEADIRERLDAVGFTAWAGSPAQLRKVMDEDYQQFGEVIKSLKISLD